MGITVTLTASAIPTVVVGWNESSGGLLRMLLVEKRSSVKDVVSIPPEWMDFSKGFPNGKIHGRHH